jgi:hypothetical protein
VLGNEVGKFRLYVLDDLGRDDFAGTAPGSEAVEDEERVLDADDLVPVGFGAQVVHSGIRGVGHVCKESRCDDRLIKVLMKRCGRSGLSGSCARGGKQSSAKQRCRKHGIYTEARKKAGETRKVDFKDAGRWKADYNCVTGLS